MRLSTAALVCANVVPLLGVLFLDWDVFSILLIFWLENVYIGAFNVVRILTAGRRDHLRRRLFTAVFFLVHYGGFTAGHGLMLLMVFGPEPTQAQIADPRFYLALLNSGLWLAAIVLFASHLFSLVVNYLLGGEYRSMTSRQAMAAPYARVVLLHVSLLIGGFLLQESGEPLFGLVILVLLKIAMDLGLHRREHRRFAGQQTARSQ